MIVVTTTTLYAITTILKATTKSETATVIINEYCIQNGDSVDYQVDTASFSSPLLIIIILRSTA